MQLEISIEEVLTEMEAGKTFELTFVRANDSKNGEKGSFKTVHATKGTRRSKSLTKSKGDLLFKQHDVIPLIEVGTKAICTPKFTHITKFNGRTVRHWTGAEA